jgi:hypothetical protein
LSRGGKDLPTEKQSPEIFSPTIYIAIFIPIQTFFCTLQLANYIYNWVHFAPKFASQNWRRP